MATAISQGRGAPDTKPDTGVESVVRRALASADFVPDGCEAMRTDAGRGALSCILDRGRADSVLDGPSCPEPFRVPVCAARALSAAGQSRVTLSLRQEHVKSGLWPTPGGKGA